MNFLENIIRESKFIGILAIVLVIMYSFLGKQRWQFYPIYFLGIIYLILMLLNRFKILELTPGFTKWLFIIGVILILISLILIIAFPTDKLPIATGKYEIGTRIFEFEDETRDEIYTKEESDKRKIKYQIWYSAENTNGYKKSKWIDEGTVLTRQLASNMHMPAFMLDHTTKIDSNSYFNAPINNDLGKYPVVIISHGWKGFRELHTDYAEELASNGFIAVSIDHTYGSQVVVFEDGTLAYINEDALSNKVTALKYKSNSNLLVTTYGEDVSSVLAELEKLNAKDSDFKGKLNLDEIGVLGHSTGGGGDVYISLNDKRIKALLGLDAWVEPLESKHLKQGLSIPALFLNSEQWSRGPNMNSLNVIANNSVDASLIQMNETNHVDFAMTYMYSPLTKHIGFTGKHGGRKSSKIQKEFIISFFDKNLRNNKENNLGETIDKYEKLNLIKVK